MPLVSISSGLPHYKNKDGSPLDGAIYIGLVGQNPITAPKQIFWDEALTQPAAQPILVSSGYAMRVGTPSELFCDGGYSILVQTHRRETVLYLQKVSAVESNTVGFTQAGAGAVERTLQDKVRETVNVLDFGVRTDGGNYTTEILNCLAAHQGREIEFPAGTFIFDGGAVLQDGTTITGAGRNATKIMSSKASPDGGALFNCFGTGSGIEDMAFDAIVPQTGGCYVKLSGPESFISEFSMNNDINGILMTGNVSRIRHGRFRDGAAGAIRIKAEGGDNSQIIEDVLMGAQSPPNISAAGIRVRNSSALMITNTSVIQQGVGLLIDPYSNTTTTGDSGSVFSLFADNCFFDNCTEGMRISTAGTGAVYRCRFSNCWFSSSSGNGVTLVGASTDQVDGLSFESCHCVLNVGSGISINQGCKSVQIISGVYAANNYGIYLENAPVWNVGIQGATIGAGFGLTGNNIGVVINGTQPQYYSVVDNYIVGNGTPILDSGGTTNKLIANNFGYATKTSGGNLITAAASSVVVNHGLAKAPPADRITLTPTTSFGANQLYIDTTSITSTQFTVRSVNAAAGNLNFSWSASTSGV